MLSVQHVYELTKSGLIVYLRGPKGEGKTTFAHDLEKYVNELTTSMCEGLGVTPYKKKMVVMNMSAIESTDFCGLPFIDEEGNTRYAKPSFLGEADILFMDEIDRVRDSAVKSSLLSLFIDRSINGHKLKEDCIILTAGNGSSNEKNNEEYDTVEFDDAMKDRLIEIPFKFSDEQKMKYFRSKYPNSKFVKFLDTQRKILKQFSGRRIEAFLKVESSLFCDLMLDKETHRLYKHFIESNLVTLSDILEGKVAAKSMSPITRTSLINEICTKFYEFDKEPDARGINVFINDIAAEEKSLYFSKLKSMCLEDSVKFSEHAKKLDLIGMFKGQKQYLQELNKG